MRFHILDEEQIGRHLASPNISDDMVLKTTADASERIEINNGATTIFIRPTARRYRAKLIFSWLGLRPPLNLQSGSYSIAPSPRQKWKLRG